MIAAVHVTKVRTWRGAAEEWENVYHYDTPLINTSSGWEALVDAIVAIEKPFHAASVTFKQARVHGPTDQGKAADVMIYVKDLTGAGTSSSGMAVNPEAAVMASWYLGRSDKGYKQILRKYWHPGALPGVVTVNHQIGTEAFPTSAITPFETAANNLKTIVIGANENNLCNPMGKKLPLGTAAKIDPWLRFRQFRRRSKRKAPLI